MTLDFVNFNANKRIRSHPFDLLPDRGEPVKMAGLKSKVDRNNVRLIITSAGKSAKIRSAQKFVTLLFAHFSYEHAVPPRSKIIADRPISIADRKDRARRTCDDLMRRGLSEVYSSTQMFPGAANTNYDQI
jgi:hypothetical protein